MYMDHLGSVELPDGPLVSQHSRGTTLLERRPTRTVSCQSKQTAPLKQADNRNPKIPINTMYVCISVYLIYIHIYIYVLIFIF